MSKVKATKLQAGDQVVCTHDRRTYTVASLILTSPDKRDRVPLVVMTDGQVITHRLLEEAS